MSQMMPHQLGNFAIPTQQAANTSIKIINFEALAVGGLEQQYLRPYEISTKDQHVINTLQNRVGESIERTGTIGNGILSGMATQILMPTAVAKGSIGIINNWDTKRFQFKMVVDITSGLRTERELVLGYTDHHGISNLVGGMNQYIDPNMLLVINSVSRVSGLNINAPSVGGGFTSPSTPKLTESAHILHDPLLGNNTNGVLNQDSLIAMRGGDVFSSLYVSTAANNSGQILSGNVLVDPMKARRSEANPHHYLTDILSTYNTQHQLYGNMANDGTRVLAESLDQVMPALTLEDPFISHLGRTATFTGMNTFTWGDLLKMDPTIDARAVFVSDVITSTSFTVGNAGQASVTNQYAAVVCSSISSMMMEYGVAELVFKATNATLNGEIEMLYNPKGCKSFAQGVNIAPHLNVIKNRMIVEVLRSLSGMGNQIPWALDCVIRLAGISLVKLAYGNPTQYEPFIFPSFADALTSSLLTRQQDDFAKLTTGISNLISQVVPNKPLQSGLLDDFGLRTVGAEAMPMGLNQMQNVDPFALGNNTGLL